MSRIPAALLYLTIYNPSLRPLTLLDTQDEDSEEQAHILFYTASERAVSRDRMLRQVGLAKALVNFSQYVFSGGLIYRKSSQAHFVECLVQTMSASTSIRSQDV